MKQSIRHNKIIELVNQLGYVSTEELVAQLDVSSQTIRRDLNELAEKNLIRRHHGGAGMPSNSENSDYTERKQFFSEQKNEIARHVAAMIPNGASLFLDIGTTSEAVAYALLSHQNLRTDGGLIGEATVNFISQFRLDFGILGISAIDSDGSMLDYDYHEVQVKRALMQSSRQVILVTDHSKFSRSAIVRLGDITEVNYLFTDLPLPLELQQRLVSTKVAVQICGN